MKEIKLVAPSGRAVEFTDGKGQVQEDKLVVLVWGPEHSGKSTLGPSCTEGIVGVIPTDRKTRFAAIKSAEKHESRILLPKEDFVREALKGIRSGWDVDEKTDAQIDVIQKATKIQYRKHINSIKDTAWAMAEHKDISLIQIDMFEQFYIDMKFAYYGRKGHVIKKAGKEPYKDTSEADQEVKDFLDSISVKHLVLTHRNKAEYVNDKATGRDLWSGWKNLGFSCNTQVEMSLNPKYNPDSDKEECQWHYGLSIVKSLHKPELEGQAGQLVLMDSLITFDNLKELVLGGS